MRTQTPATAPARVIHYVDVAPVDHADLVPYTARAMATRRREQQVLYARWVRRQAVIAERDRKVRRFLVGLGATLGLAVVAAVGLLGWLIFHMAGDLIAVLVGAVVVVLVLAGLAGAGHRCVTVVQHWH